MGGLPEPELNPFPIDYWHELETKAALLEPMGTDGIAAFRAPFHCVPVDWQCLDSPD